MSTHYSASLRLFSSFGCSPAEHIKEENELSTRIFHTNLPSVHASLANIGVHNYILMVTWGSSGVSICVQNWTQKRKWEDLMCKAWSFCLITQNWLSSLFLHGKSSPSLLASPCETIWWLVWKGWLGLDFGFNGVLCQLRTMLAASLGTAVRRIMNCHLYQLCSTLQA